MNQELANFSTDLLRISRWIYKGQDKLASSVLDLCQEKYKNIDPKIGCYSNIWQEIDKIRNMEGLRLQASERALTLSRILLMRTRGNSR